MHGIWWAEKTKNPLWRHKGFFCETSNRRGLQGQAASDFDRCAVDVAGFVGGQEGVQVGDFFRLGHALHRHAVFHGLDHFFRHGLEDRGGHETRAHGIGTDALLAQFLGPGVFE